jgi:hypothetical protein
VPGVVALKGAVLPLKSVAGIVQIIGGRIPWLPQRWYYRLVLLEKCFSGARSAPEKHKKDILFVCLQNLFRFPQ